MSSNTFMVGIQDEYLPEVLDVVFSCESSHAGDIFAQIVGSALTDFLGYSGGIESPMEFFKCLDKALDAEVHPIVVVEVCHD